MPAGSPGFRASPTFCAPNSSVGHNITGADAAAISACLVYPGSGACWLYLQDVLVATGCVDCLPFASAQKDRLREYCKSARTREECATRVGPCQHRSPIIGAAMPCARWPARMPAHTQSMRCAAHAASVLAALLQTWRNIGLGLSM